MLSVGIAKNKIITTDLCCSLHKNTKDLVSACTTYIASRMMGIYIVKGRWREWREAVTMCHHVHLMNIITQRDKHTPARARTCRYSSNMSHSERRGSKVGEAVSGYQETPTIERKLDELKTPALPLQITLRRGITRHSNSTFLVPGDKRSLIPTRRNQTECFNQWRALKTAFKYKTHSETVKNTLVSLFFIAKIYFSTWVF